VQLTHMHRMIATLYETVGRSTRSPQTDATDMPRGSVQFSCASYCELITSSDCTTQPVVLTVLRASR